MRGDKKDVRICGTASGLLRIFFVAIIFVVLIILSHSIKVKFYYYYSLLYSLL